MRSKSIVAYLPWLLLAPVLSAVLAGALRAQQPAGSAAAPQPTLLVDLDHRTQQSLDGDWHYMADPYNAGLFDFHMHVVANGYFKDEAPVSGSNRLVEYDFAKSPTLKVPGDWNTQAAELKLYEGGLWYERHFKYVQQMGQRTFLHIGAANYRAKAFVNGQLVCEHEGGYTPFDCEATRVIRSGDNSVVIYVDNTRLADGVPTLKTDWYNYGGLTRDVSLVTVHASFIDDFDLHLDKTRTAIEGYVHLRDAEPGAQVEVAIPELHLRQSVSPDQQGRAPIRLAAAGLSLWSPEHPKLYKVQLTATREGAEADSLVDEMGFRTVAVDGSKILLNGKPIVLHGVSVHAEAPYRTGRAYSDADVAALTGWVKELGANFMRLAHYPHDERMTRAADKLGILVWSEVPDYWALQFENPAVFAKSTQQLDEMVRRDRDKASVILWSIANETPLTPARTDYLTRCAAFVRSRDSSRLVTAALLVRSEGDTKVIDDPLGKALDVIGFNEYIGWYEGSPESADKTTWRVAYDKPLIVSEFGAGARSGLHGSASERWTEEYQASVYRHQIAMLNRIPQLRGATPWVLMDFRSPVRQLVGIQDGFNRKGLVSDQGKKKQAFFVLQQAYHGNSLGHAE